MKVTDVDIKLKILWRPTYQTLLSFDVREKSRTITQLYSLKEVISNCF